MRQHQYFKINHTYDAYFSCSALQEAQQYADIGYMDREQFKKIFDELDKDCIKEVLLCLMAAHQYISLFRFIYLILSVFASVRVCSAQHPPMPEYNSQVLQRLQGIFSHYYLTIFGNIVALANVICIGVSRTLSYTL